MTIRLVAVPDVFLPDGSVRRGKPPETSRERRIRQVKTALSYGWITYHEAQILLLSEEQWS